MLKGPLCQMIKDHIEAGLTVLMPESHFKKTPGREEQSKNTKEVQTDDPASLEKIVSMMEKDVLPAVAQDGGFISVKAFEKGVLYLQMQGACSGCPSSTITLKQGIESHLKSHVPELKEVVAV